MNISYKSSLKILLLVLLIVTASGCSLGMFQQKSEGCKMRTYIDNGLSDYISTRFHSKQPVRLAIIPFDVPANFAPSGNDSLHFGRELARKFQSEILRTGEITIVEILPESHWPGKKQEFFTGNYRSIELARLAGYDLVLVGQMDDLTNDEEIVLDTKIIDVHNNVTVWNVKTMSYSRARSERDKLARMRLAKQRPELFDFTNRGEYLAYCTVNRIFPPLIPEPTRQPQY